MKHVIRFFLLSFHQNSSALAIGWWNFTAARFYNFRTNFHRASLTRVVIWADCCCCCCCCYCAFFSRVLFRNTSCSHTNWKLKLLCSLFIKLKWVSNSSNSKYKRKSKLNTKWNREMNQNKITLAWRVRECVWKSSSSSSSSLSKQK